MGKAIAVANQKGGVGKTTTAINLSACLAEQGMKVLTVDIDPQGNTTSGLGIDKSTLDKTTYQLLLGDCSVEECMTESILPNLFVLPSDVNLAGAEIELIGIERELEGDYIVSSYLLYTNARTILIQFMETVILNGMYHSHSTCSD